MNEKVRELVESWQKLIAEWDAEDRTKFDGPAFLYTRSIRVAVLMQCTDAVRAALAEKPAPSALAELEAIISDLRQQLNNANAYIVGRAEKPAERPATCPACGSLNRADRSVDKRIDVCTNEWHRAERPQLSAEQVRDAASYVTLRLPGKLNWDTSERTEHGKILHRLLSAALLTGVAEKVSPAMKGESNEPVQESLQSDAHPVLEAVQTYEETMRVANREDGRPVICSSAPAAPPVLQAEAVGRDWERADKWLGDWIGSYDPSKPEWQKKRDDLGAEFAAIRREAEQAGYQRGIVYQREATESIIARAERAAFEKAALVAEDCGRWRMPRGDISVAIRALADSPVSGERKRKTE